MPGVTYLDLSHQLEILQLLDKLNKEQGRTILMVIHDLNHAARFSHYMIALKKGRVIKEGTAEEVMTPGILEDVFRLSRPVCSCADLLQSVRQSEKRLPICRES